MGYFYLLLTMVFGYLVGSVNLSIVVTKYIGKFDIRTKGSGNAGGTNVVRTMGAKWGISVIVVEIAKGFAAGLLAKYLFPGDVFGIGEVGAVISGCLAVFGCMIGNRFPCFHGFKGGKGVTTCAAVMGVLDWRVLLILIGIFLVVFFVSKMVSLASMIASVGMPISTAIIYNDQSYWWVTVIITGLMCVLLIFNHRSNIERIAKGTENKFNFGKRSN